MEITTVLAKIFGLYLIAAGLVYLLRHRYYMSVTYHIVEERLTRMILAGAELLVGLVLVIIHNQWAIFPAGVISLFGWLLAAEGVFYLFAPDKVVRKIIRFFNVKIWYIFGGLLSVILGIYLTGYGFGYFY